MQNSQRHPSQLDRPGLASASGANMRLLLANSGARKPAAEVTTYVRIAAPGLLTAALGSHVWLGFTACLALTLAVIAILLGAAKLRLGSKRPATWAKQVNFGERIWLNRMLVSVPQGINYRLTTFYIVFWVGSLVAVLGAVTTTWILTFTGLLVAYVAQFASFQKLAYLYRIMKDRNPLYRFWTISPENDNKRAAKVRCNNA